jgi:hypothetical protein
MSERGRFALITTILLVAIAISVFVDVRRIETKLLAGAQLALSAAGIPFYGLKMDGRDAGLSGFVASTEESDRIVQTVAAVPGVRAVHDATVVERIAGSGAPGSAGTGRVGGAPGAARAQGPAPQVRIQRVGSRIRVSGRLPEGEAASWIEALSSRFDERQIESALLEDRRMSGTAWVGERQAIADLVAGIGDGVLTIRGDTASLSGMVSGRAERDRISERAQAISSLTWRFDLFSLDGTVSGGGL